MDEVISSGFKLIAALFLVVLNGLFVAAEFAFVKIRTSKVESMVREGKASAGLVKEVTGKLDAYLAVCQLGITVSSLALGALGEPAVAALIAPLLEPLGVSDETLHFAALVIGFGLITFVHMVFGELAPKSVAIARPEGTSRFVAPFMQLFYYAFLPGIWFFNGTANAFVRALGIPPASESEETYSEEELLMLVGRSGKQGFLEEDEEARVKAVFELDEKVAREIMVPRPDVVSLPAGMRLRKLVSMVTSGSYTRYPIYEGDSSDRIIGAVHIKDVLRAVESEGSLDADIEARDLIRDVLVVPENRLVDDVLEDFQEQEIQMAIVVDEWGSFEGLITTEDIFEEIVGELRDEFDEEESAVRELDDGSYSVGGRIPIRTTNEVLSSGFESEDFDTIGGLVFGRLGHAPEVGDEVVLDGYTLRVEEVDGPRIVRVVVRRGQG